MTLAPTWSLCHSGEINWIVDEIHKLPFDLLRCSRWCHPVLSSLIEEQCCTFTAASLALGQEQFVCAISLVFFFYIKRITKILLLLSFLFTMLILLKTVLLKESQGWTSQGCLNHFVASTSWKLFRKKSPKCCSYIIISL